MATEASIVLCLPAAVGFEDPDPVLTSAKNVRLVSTWQDDTIGVVGWSDGGWSALALAAAHPELPRLAILSTPFPEDEAGIEVDLATVASKTLLLFGSADPLTGNRHGTQWQKRLSSARLKMVPRAGHDILQPMWKRVLSHVAPRR